MVGESFVTTALDYLNHGMWDSSHNKTIITLIPKTKAATRMSEFRPINLTGVLAKVIITKVLVNRLQQILPELVSAQQYAFIKGRLISDNFVIAHEMTHFIDTKSGGKTVYVAMKLDMSKAYDRLKWSFWKLCWANWV